jgi:hypothetical protein
MECRSDALMLSGKINIRRYHRESTIPEDRIPDRLPTRR